MEYSKEDLMEAKKQILGVGENMGTEESKKIWEENAQFWNVHNKRLTFSACYAGKGPLFREIVKQCRTSVHSILGFSTKVDFDLASAFWISYYTVVTRLTNYRVGKNCDHIQSGGLAKIIENVGVMYGLKLRFCYPHLFRNEWYCCDEEFTPVLTHWRNQQNFKIS